MPLAWRPPCTLPQGRLNPFTSRAFSLCLFLPRACAPQIEVLRKVCSSGILEGENLEAASPIDISFWPIHPTLERIWMYKKILGKFTDERWPAVGTSSYGDSCTGHRSTDSIKISGLLGSDDYYTNGEFYSVMDPTDDTLPYIYDNFGWEHCEQYGYDFTNMVETDDATDDPNP
jgi:hypothetical protein